MRPSPAIVISVALAVGGCSSLQGGMARLGAVTAAVFETTSGVAGAGALPAGETDPHKLFEQSMISCDAYRRTQSLAQRGASSGLALLAATSAALGLAFTPAGAATLAGFTAASAIFAGASAAVEESTFDLAPVEIARRFHRHYTEPMTTIAQEMASAGPAARAEKTQEWTRRIRLAHSHCSLAVLAGLPSPPPASEVNSQKPPPLTLNTRGPPQRR